MWSSLPDNCRLAGRCEETKIAFNLTKRQLICFGSAAAVGIPSYLLAMYERDGLPFEKVVRNTIRARINSAPIKKSQSFGLDDLISIKEWELANGVDNEHPALVAFMKHQNIKTLNREILIKLVDYIKVYGRENMANSTLDEFLANLVREKKQHPWSCAINLSWFFPAIVYLFQSFLLK